MKSLVSVLATATASAALTGCLATAPTTQDNSGSNAPRALATTPAATAAAPVAPKAAAIKWNDESCNKTNLTENTINTDKVCVRLVQGFATVAPAAKATTTTRNTTAADRKNPAKAIPTAAAAQSTTATIDTTKPQTVFAASFSLTECTKTANAATTAGNVLGGIGNVLGGFGNTLGKAATQAANRTAGGGLAGRAAAEATGSVVNPVTQNGQRAANNKQTEVTTACSTQISNVINGDFKTAITGLSEDFSKTNNGAKAAYTVTSELPKAYETQLKAAVGEPTVQTRSLQR